jgi:hypothetical protein
MKRLVALATGVVLVSCDGGDSTGPSTRDFVGTYDLLDSKSVSQADASIFRFYCCQNGETEVLRLFEGGTYEDTFDSGMGSPGSATGKWSVRGDSMFVSPDLQPGIRYSFGVSLQRGVMVMRVSIQEDVDGDGTYEPAYLVSRYDKR